MAPQEKNSRPLNKLLLKHSLSSLFKNQNIQTVLGDLEADVTCFFINPIIE
jgi:hypothetical protein